MRNGLAHYYHLDESTLILGASDVFIFISFFNEIPLSNSPRWDAMFFSVISGGIQYAYVP